MLHSCQNETKKEEAKSQDSTSATVAKATVPTPVPESAKVDPAPKQKLPPPPIAQTKRFYEFAAMENPPTYPGGISKFYKTLFSNIKYPEAAKAAHIEGTVLLSFIIDETGNIDEIKVDRKLGSGTDEEAIRVLKLAHQWTPGKVDGYPVRVKFNLPVKFALSK